MGTSSGGVAADGDYYWRGSRGGVAVAAAVVASGGGGPGGEGAFTAASARGSPFAAASWFKDRVRDGKRRIHMQVTELCVRLFLCTAEYTIGGLLAVMP